MKTFTILFGLFFTISCQNLDDKKNIVPFESDKQIIGDFYSRCNDSYSGDTKPTQIAYLYKGSIFNNSDKLYEKVVVNLSIIMELENGNLITSKDYGSEYFGEGILALESFEHWKSKESKNIERLISIDIPTKYIDYPIKRVIAEFKFECEDQINKKNQDYIAEKDVTDSWKKVVQKTKKNQSDCKSFLRFIEQIK